MRVGDRVTLNDFGRKWLLPNWRCKSDTGTVTAVITDRGDAIRVKRDGMKTETSTLSDYWQPVDNTRS